MLTILSVGYPFALIGVDPVGGAEQVLAQLDRALTAAGHRSIVIAPEGSDVKQVLRPVPAPVGEITDAVRKTVHAAVRALIDQELSSGLVDLVHYHGVDFADYAPDASVPQLATLHLPISWYPEATFRPDMVLVPVSEAQARTAPAGLALLSPIPNGVDLNQYRPTEEVGEHALILGRVAPEKGFHHALAATRAADVPLVAAGEVYPYSGHRAFFRDEVEPALDERRRFVGPVAGVGKRQLLAEARCLLAPFTAPETSSLVAMEALASGTPVIAYGSGALPEVVEHGVTGFIVSDAAEMAEAIGRVGEIDPAACRRAAEARFDVRRMTDAYLTLYAELTA